MSPSSNHHHNHHQCIYISPLHFVSFWLQRTHPMPGRCHGWSLIPTKRRYCRGFGVQVGRLSLLGKLSGWCGVSGGGWGGYYTLERTTRMVCGWKFGLVSFGGRKIVWLQKQCVRLLLKPCLCGFFDLVMLEFAWTMHMMKQASFFRKNRPYILIKEKKNLKIPWSHQGYLFNFFGEILLYNPGWVGPHSLWPIRFFSDALW